MTKQENPSPKLLAHRARNAAYMERIKADPERYAAFLERGRQKAARKRARAKVDPVVKARMQDSQRRYRESVYADEQAHAASLERSRIAYRLRQEKAGRSLDNVRNISTAKNAHRGASFNSTVPAAPFLDWLDRTFPTLSDGERADRLKIEERRLFACRHQGQPVISIDVVDRAFVTYGDVGLLNDLYPLDDDEIAAA
jgi:hypothetical protein